MNNKMMMLVYVCVVCFLCGYGFVPPKQAAAEAAYSYQNEARLSTWLWNTAEIVDRPDQVIQDLAGHHVRQLQLQIEPSIDNSHYRAFIKAAAAQGIEVHALDGAPEWAGADGGTLQQAFLGWLKRYQLSAAADERFAGIHLDVEPYEHAQYGENTDALLEGYQSMIVKFKNQSAQLGLAFSIDIPFWFYGVIYNNDKFGTGNMAEWLCKRVKSITIMAYRDAAQGPESILGIAAAEMKLFLKHNVQGTIAVETGKLAASDEFVTFYEEGRAYMNEQLEAVYQTYKDHPEFAGIAIHHYDSWMAMN